MSQVLVRNATNHAAYVFDDGDTVTQDTDRVFCDHFTIGDLNSSNSTLHTGVTDVPGDWKGNKYFYDGATWTLDSNFNDTEPPEPPIE